MNIKRLIMNLTHPEMFMIGMGLLIVVMVIVNITTQQVEVLWEIGDIIPKELVDNR